MLAVVLIRHATPDDWAAIWPFFRDIVRAGETYNYPIDIAEAPAEELWMLTPPAATVVAVDDRGGVLGSAKVGPNFTGASAHIATASFMVDPTAAGQGVGRALGEYALEWARGEGYRAMQFNAVVESNVRAVALWKALGFEVIGTVPAAFRRPSGEYVGLHIMYRTLAERGR